jgi:hypothetical protein
MEDLVDLGREKRPEVEPSTSGLHIRRSTTTLTRAQGKQSPETTTLELGFVEDCFSTGLR